MTINREEVIKIQEELSNLVGVPGHEHEVAEYLLTKLEVLVDRAWIDPLGNLLAVKEGKDPNGLRILLDAHIDEVGFMINHIEEKGFIRFDTLGGIDKRVLLGSLVQFVSDTNEKIVGVIGVPAPHTTSADEREKVPNHLDMFVDIGAKSQEEVLEKGLHIGSVGTFYTKFLQVNDETIMGKAFDDRTACNVLLHTLKELAKEEIPNTILINFAVQEEVGTRGAKVGAYTLDPNIALALENTIASDFPGVAPHKIVSAIGEGPTVSVADKTVIVPKKILTRISQAAENVGVKWQYKKPTYGGTDAGSISVTKQGVPSGVIAVPCRYIHGPVGVLRVDDIIETIKLVTEFCRMK